MKVRVAAVVLLSVLLGASAWAGPARVAGTAYFQDSALGHTLETSGRLVEHGVSLLTGDRFAIVVLENSRIVKVASNSAVRFEEGEDAGVTMTVYAGYASIVGASGRVLRAGAVGTVNLEPRIEDRVRIEEVLLEDEGGDPAASRRDARGR